MDVTRSCLECEDGASGLWMAPPVCFAAVFRSLVVGYGVMVVDSSKVWNSKWFPSPNGLRSSGWSCHPLSSTRPLAASSQIASLMDRMMDANCSWVYFSLRGSAVRQKCGEALTLQFTGLPPVR